MTDPVRDKEATVGEAMNAYLRRRGHPVPAEEVRTGPLTGEEAFVRAIRSKGAEKIEKTHEEETSDAAAG